MAGDNLRKRENTRARLLESAISVFLNKGFNGARIDDVVKGAGFTRGAFYSNFSSMEELLHEVVLSQAEEIIEKFRQGLANYNKKMGLEALLVLFESAREQGRTVYILVTELMLFQLRNPGKTVGVAESYTRFESEVMALVDQILKAMGRYPTVPIESVTNIIISSFLGVIAHSEIDGRGVDEVIYPFLHGTIEALSLPNDVEDTEVKAGAEDVGAVSRQMRKTE